MKPNGAAQDGSGLDRLIPILIDNDGGADGLCCSHSTVYHDGRVRVASEGETPYRT